MKVIVIIFFINNLLKTVKYPFEENDIKSVISLYKLGTITKGYRKGAITFPFIDVNNGIRTVQIKQFNKANNTIGTDFLHSILVKEYNKNNKRLPKWLDDYLKQDKRVTCLFGEHLLNKYPNNPIALVEAPKTAIYGALCFGLPDNPNNFIWLAVYNKSSFNIDKLEVLKGKTIFTFPDLSKNKSTFNEWKNKAKKFEGLYSNTKFIFSDLLENIATDEDKKEGKDIADFLIKYDWRLYRKDKNTSNNKPIKNTIKLIDSNINKFETLPKLRILKPPLKTNISKPYQRNELEINIDNLYNYLLSIVNIENEVYRINQSETTNDYKKTMLCDIQYLRTHKEHQPSINRINTLINLICIKPTLEPAHTLE